MRKLIALFCLLLITIMVCPAAALAASTELLVSFKGDDGMALAGTLELPADKPSGAAVVLLAGSGSTNGDGNQPPSLKTDLLKQIARGLADRGIVSLRFDKRGMYANRAELPADQSKYEEFFSWEHFVGDAAAGYRFLQQQPNVTPNRVAILGHSEGGLLALDAARKLKSDGHSPAALILVSTPGRSMDVIIDEQPRACRCGRSRHPGLSDS
jgi:dienelactone hydrolase